MDLCPLHSNHSRESVNQIIQEKIAEPDLISIMKWAEKNQMTLNLSKTWEMSVKSRSPKVPPAPLAIVDPKGQLKSLGVTFETDPMNRYTCTY